MNNLYISLCLHTCAETTHTLNAADSLNKEVSNRKVIIYHRFGEIAGPERSSWYTGQRERALDAGCAASLLLSLGTIYVLRALHCNPTAAITHNRMQQQQPAEAAALFGQRIIE